MFSKWKLHVAMPCHYSKRIVNCDSTVKWKTRMIWRSVSHPKRLCKDNECFKMERTCSHDTQKWSALFKWQSVTKCHRKNKNIEGSRKGKNQMLMFHTFFINVGHSRPLFHYFCRVTYTAIYHHHRLALFTGCE